VGLVDAQGNVATFTGRECLEWAGGMTGRHFAVQGNILVSQETVSAMAEAFERAHGELADRLVAALAAGQKAGGDRRGQQSAALLVVHEKGGYAGFNDRYVDLRVDDHRRPIARLRELLDLHHLYFKRPDPESLIPIDKKLARELQRIVRQSGHYAGRLTGDYDEATRTAVERLVGVENLEERWPPLEASGGWQPDERIDPIVLEFLQKAYPAQKRPEARGAKRMKKSRRR